MRASGYGADLELTGDSLVIHAGTVAARIQASPTVTIPLADITRLHWRDAGVLVNGRLRVFVADGVDLTTYGPPPNRINPQSLVVHWRRRDRATFAALRARLDPLAARPSPPFVVDLAKLTVQLGAAPATLAPDHPRTPDLAEERIRGHLAPTTRDDRSSGGRVTNP